MGSGLLAAEKPEESVKCKNQQPAMNSRASEETSHGRRGIQTENWATNELTPLKLAQNATFYSGLKAKFNRDFCINCATRMRRMAESKFLPPLISFLPSINRSAVLLLQL